MVVVPSSALRYLKRQTPPAHAPPAHSLPDARTVPSACAAIRRSNHRFNIMKTRRGGAGRGAQEGKEPAIKLGRVRKPAAKKASGARVTKKVVLRGRSSTRAAEVEHQPPRPDLASQEVEDEEEEEEQQQHDEQAQRDDEERGPQRARKRRSWAAAATAAAAPGPSSKAAAHHEESVVSLTAEALQEVFVHLSRDQQQSYCRWVLRSWTMQAASVCRLVGLHSNALCMLPPATGLHPPFASDFTSMLQGNPAPGMQALQRGAAGAKCGVGGKLRHAVP